MDDRRLKQLELMAILTGSILDPKQILTQYQTLTQPKKHYLYTESNRIIKKMKSSFDKEHPILAVYIGILAYENNVDPAVCLLCYLNKGKWGTSSI